MINIKKGEFYLTVPRTSLIEVVETPDGACFNFKEGLALNVIDPQMPNHTKNIMKNTTDNFPKGDLNFDLKEYNKPVSVDTT
jgi:hypothetical protein